MLVLSCLIVEPRANCLFFMEKRTLDARRTKDIAAEALEAPKEAALEDYILLLPLCRDELGSCIWAIFFVAWRISIDS